ncbi:MAG: DUF4148 domain-containing protein [Ramlibacter sp.]
MNATKLFAVTAFAALSAFAAHADEADGSQRGLMFNSTRSAAEVRAEATMPVHISNGGTGYIGLTQSAVTPADVKAQAIAAVRTGQTSRGEIGLM